MILAQSRSGGRRKFLAQVGGLAVAAVAAPARSGATSIGGDEHGFDNAAVRRANEAFRLRLRAATFQRHRPLPRQLTNGDERRYSNFIGNFSKSLPHDAFGIVDDAAYAALLHAMRTAASSDFAVIPQGGVGKLSNPQSAFAFQLDGSDSHALATRVPPAFASAEEAAEIAEDYWLALTRDVPFANYGTDTAIAAAAASLSSFSDFRGPKIGGLVTPATIFRGPTAGDLVGPYISQFLAKTIQYGPYSVPQRVRAGLANVEYMTDYASWLNIQNGAAPPPFAVDPPESARFINDNRSLSAYLRADFSPQGFINAGLMLLGLGPGALSPSNPYRLSVNQAGLATFGGGELIDLIVHAAAEALKACWYQKWAVHRRVRPEAFAGAIHNRLTAGQPYPIHHEILDATALLGEVHNRFGTFLLPMGYPEGCPIHPAFPAGHAAFSGAGATMLKAFFDETAIVPLPVVASADGSTLDPYSGPPLTVGNELNKLASNISVGRDAPGVHWRSDGVAGMLLGEASAISILQDVANMYSETYPGFTLTRFDGTKITIEPRNLD